MKLHLLNITFFLCLNAFGQVPQRFTTIGSPDKTETASSIVADDAGNIYIGGSSDNRGLIVKQNSNNQTIWSKNFTFPGAENLYVDLNFMDRLADTLFGCGTIKSESSPQGTFYFKMDAQTGNFYWSRYELISHGYFSSMRYANGKYFLVGGRIGISNPMTAIAGIVEAVSSQTGTGIWSTPYISFNIPANGNSNHTYFKSATEMKNGKMFITGEHFRHANSPVLVRPMPFVLGIDEDGVYFMAKRLNIPVTANSTYGYVGEAIKYDMSGDIIVSCSKGANNELPNDPGLIVAKLDLMGNLIFVKSYAIAGNGASHGFFLNETADSYIFSGLNVTGFNGYHVLKTSKQGIAEKCVGISKPNIYYGFPAEYAYGQSDFRNDKHYFVTSEAYFVENDVNINKLILNEDLTEIDDCSDLLILPVEQSIVAMQTQEMTLYYEAIGHGYDQQIIVEEEAVYVPCASTTLNLQESADCDHFVTATVSGFQSPSFYWSTGAAIDTNSTEVGNANMVIVRVLDVRCCELIDTIYPQMTVTPMTASLPQDTVFCEGNSISLTPEIQNAAGQTVFQWYNGNTGSSITVTASGTYWVDVTDNCRTLRDSINVTVVELPEITGIQNTVVCDYDFPFQLNPQLIDADSFFWEDNSTVLQRSVSGAGIFTLSAVNICGQTDSTIEITSLNLPEISLVNSIDTCVNQGQSVNLAPNHEHIIDFLWSNGLTTENISVSTSGTYTVYGSNSCGTDSASVLVTINYFPVINLPTSIDTCFEIGEGFLFTAQGSAGNYQWSSGSQTATELITQEGQYFCTVTNNCGTATDSVIVTRLPDLDLYLPEDSLLLCQKQISIDYLKIESYSTYEVLLPWSKQPAGEILTESGLYYVRAFNKCADLFDSVYIDLKEDQLLFMPNSFTPNADGMNDRLEISGLNVSIKSLRIFNRWGEEIYTLNEPEFQVQPWITWDGTFNGLPCQDGIYQVSIVYQNCFGMPKEFNGHVNLLR